jgi:predicted dehydrogenase
MMVAHTRAELHWISDRLRIRQCEGERLTNGGHTVDIGVVGCGFVSYLYGGTLGNHPTIRVIGAYDACADRTRMWCEKFGGTAFDSLEGLLDSPARIVVNLTNPSSHYGVTKACLNAGKHVYSEKPVAQTEAGLRELFELAERRGLFVGCAPCSLLGEAAQTLWHAVNSGIVGKIHTAYVALSMVPTNGLPADAWARSQQQGGLAAAKARTLAFPVPWPYEDEFAVGPAREHAAYPLKWLTSWFGPVKSITNYSSLRAPRKLGWDYLQRSIRELHSTTHDLFVSCLSLEDDVEVVLVNSTVLGLDLRFMLFGQSGTLELNDQWDYASPVRITRTGVFMPPTSFGYPLVMRPTFRRNYPRGHHVNMDFVRGIAHLARSVEAGSQDRYVCDPAQELHVQEVTDLVSGSVRGEIAVVSRFGRRPRPLPLPREVGLAWVGGSHHALEDLQALPRSAPVRLIGVVANPSGSKGAIEAGTPDELVRFDRLASLLLDERVDLVLNCAPLESRARTTLACLRARKHVFSAHPLAPTFSEAQEIQSTADRLGVRVGCSPPGVSEARVRDFIDGVGVDGLSGGRLGGVRNAFSFIQCREDVDFSPHEAAALHGPVADTLARHLWIATEVLGPVWRVRARRDADTEQLLALTMTFSSGAVLESCLRKRAAEAPNDAIRFVGEQGEAVLNTNGSLGSELAAAAVVQMCERICEGRPHPDCVEQAAHILEVLEMICASLRSGRESVSASPAIQGAWQGMRRAFA